MRTNPLPQTVINGNTPDQEASLEDHDDGGRLPGGDRKAFAGKPEEKDAADQAEGGDNGQQGPPGGHSETEPDDRKQA